MKKLLLIACLFVSAWSYGQSIQYSQPINTAADLLAMKGNDGVLYKIANLNTVGDGKGGDFVYRASSVKPIDNTNILGLSGATAGRFERQPNASLLFGTASLTGVSLQQSYIVNFNTPLTSTNYFVIPVLTSDNMSLAMSVTSKTVNGFTIRFTAIPAVGASITIDYLVKQLN